MTTATLPIVLLLVVLAFYLAIGLREYLRYRGTRLITCPETRRPAAVEVDEDHAAVTALWDHPQLRLQHCSRWPERRNCGQECLAQIETGPDDCQIRTIVARWFAGKRCAICREAIGPIHGVTPKPGLLNPERAPVPLEWIRPEDLPDTLETHRPICANCLVVETFRRQFPDLVIERPARYRQSGNR
jgi:hypothetical protein